MSCIAKLSAAPARELPPLAADPATERSERVVEEAEFLRFWGGTYALSLVCAPGGVLFAGGKIETVLPGIVVAGFAAGVF